MQVENKAQVFERLQRIRSELAALGVRRVGLFGSFVRDEQRTESDVDILLEFDPEKKNFDNFMHTAFLLEETMERR